MHPNSKQVLAEILGLLEEARGACQDHIVTPTETPTPEVVEKKKQPKTYRKQLKA